MKNLVEKQTVSIPNVRLCIGIGACVGFLLDALIAARCAKKAGQAMVETLNKIIAREHMGWCEALINKDVQGMQQTAIWINCCLGIAEMLKLDVTQPLEWHGSDD
jgi:hypothetical protein